MSDRASSNSPRRTISWSRPAAAPTSRRESPSVSRRERAMTACRGISRTLLPLSLAIFCLGQDVPQVPDRTAKKPEEISLTEISTVEVPSLPAESIGAPLMCDPDGGILFRLATPEAGPEDPVSVSKDGKTVVRFGRDKVNDIPRPALHSAFLAGSSVYIITRGSAPLGYETKWHTPTGEVSEQPASKSGTFIAHFERNGNYAGAVSLDLPFRPLQLGVFENGDFLIAGADPSSGEPRVAIVASNGQLRRFLELKGDIHAQQESETPEREKDPTALPRFRPAPGRPPPVFRDGNPPWCCFHVSDCKRWPEPSPIPSNERPRVLDFSLWRSV